MAWPEGTPCCSRQLLTFIDEGVRIHLVHPELEENEFQMTCKFTRVREPLLCWVGGFCKQIFRACLNKNSELSLHLWLAFFFGPLSAENMHCQDVSRVWRHQATFPSFRKSHRTPRHPGFNNDFQKMTSSELALRHFDGISGSRSGSIWVYLGQVGKFRFLRVCIVDVCNTFHLFVFRCFLADRIWSLDVW